MLRLICLVVIAFAVTSACGGSDDANKASPTVSGSSGTAASSAAATAAPDAETSTAGSSAKPESTAFLAYKASVTGLYDAAGKPVPAAVTKAMAGCNDVEGTRDIYYLVNDCSTVAQTIARDMPVTPAVQQSLQVQHDFMLAQIDKSSLESARDLGANWLKTFREVIIPQSMPGIVIGAIFVFVLSMGDYGTVSIIGKGQVTSVGVLVSTQVTSIQYPGAAASAAILVLAMMVGVFVLLRFSNLREEL